MYFLKKFHIIAIKDWSHTAIINNQLIRYTIIHLNQDLIVLRINYHNGNYIYITIYAPRSGILDDTLTSLECFIHEYENIKIVIIGDLNTKHVIWGNLRTDT